MEARLILFLALIGFAFAFDANFYTNSENLSDKYTLHWKVEGDTIHVALQVQTTGWVGLGIAEPTSGSMPGADMLTGMLSFNSLFKLRKKFDIPSN